MIKCLIVDDEPLAREAIRSYINKLPEFCIVDECENALEATTAIRKASVDLIFLDIEMPEINGIAFIQTLKNAPSVIFTTAYRNYAVEAFEIDAIDYLLKPISFDRFMAAINKYHDRSSTSFKPNPISKERTESHITVKADRKNHIVDISSILYIEGLKDYVKIVCTNDTFITHDSLANLEASLINLGFIRIHRSYLVAINKIRSYDSESIFLENKELPISRTFKKTTLTILGEQMQ